MERLGVRPSVQPLAELLKIPSTSMHSSNRTPQNHIELVADGIDEPQDDRFVPMLEALAPEEASYYTSEANVLDYSGKSSVLFSEIEQRYGFVGGSSEAYANYFLRKDLPARLWHFALAEDVKAVAGFAVVSKKQEGRQRKLLMMCAANYLWADARGRADHGLRGGDALSRLWVDRGSVRPNLGSSVSVRPRLGSSVSVRPRLGSSASRFVRVSVRPRLGSSASRFVRVSVRPRLGSSVSVRPRLGSSASRFVRVSVRPRLGSSACRLVRKHADSLC